MSKWVVLVTVVCASALSTVLSFNLISADAHLKSVGSTRWNFPSSADFDPSWIAEVPANWGPWRRLQNASGCGISVKRQDVDLSRDNLFELTVISAGIPFQWAQWEILHPADTPEELRLALKSMPTQIQSSLLVATILVHAVFWCIVMLAVRGFTRLQWSQLLGYRLLFLALLLPVTAGSVLLSTWLFIPKSQSQAWFGSIVVESPGIEPWVEWVFGVQSSLDQYITELPGCTQTTTYTRVSSICEDHLQVGWPVRLIQRRTYFDMFRSRTPINGLNQSLRSGIETPHLVGVAIEFLTGAQPKYLPVEPIWPQFTTVTLLAYLLVTGGALAIEERIHAFRGLMRTRVGRCSKCGFLLDNGSSCPECGPS